MGCFVLCVRDGFVSRSTRREREVMKVTLASSSSSSAVSLALMSFCDRFASKTAAAAVMSFESSARGTAARSLDCI